MVFLADSLQEVEQLVEYEELLVLDVSEVDNALLRKGDLSFIEERRVQ